MTPHTYRLIMQEKEVVVGWPHLFPGLDLTARESEVLYWLSEGKPNLEMANQRSFRAAVSY